MQLTIATPRLCRRDGQGLVNVEIVAEALRRGHSLRCLCAELDAEFLHHPRVEWVRAGSLRLPTQLLKSLSYICAATVRLALDPRPAEPRLANGFCFAQPADIVAVHFLHRTWLASEFHASRERRGPARLYYWAHEALHALFERAALARARAIVAVSQKVRDDLLRLGYGKAPIRVIPNGVDTGRFHDGPGDRAAFHLPEQVPLALFAGDLRSRRKNLDVVLRALPQVPELHVAVAGFCSRSSYPAQVAALGLAQRVHFIGYQPDMPALLRAVDFVLYPSHYDPFGLVVLEACAAARPVVVSRVAGVSGVLDERCAVLLDPPTDSDALAQAMRRLAASPDLRRKMGAAGRKRAEALSWRAMAAGYLELLEAAAAQGGEPISTQPRHGAAA